MSKRDGYLYKEEKEEKRQDGRVTIEKKDCLLPFLRSKEGKEGGGMLGSQTTISPGRKGRNLGN